MRSLNFIILLLISTSFIGCINNNSKDYSLIPFSDGKKWGFVNQKGQVVIQPQFTDLDYNYDRGVFSDGLIMFENNNFKNGFINSKGTIIIDTIFTGTTQFIDGIAIAVKDSEYLKAINKKGKVLFELSGINSCGIFSDGMAIILRGREFGFINKKGQIQIEPQFLSVYNFKKGVTPAQSCDGENKWGIIDKSGKWIVAPKFEFVSQFSDDGLASVKEGNYFGFIDMTGKFIIEPQFEYVEEFHEGFCVCKRNGLLGYIDKSGTFKINPQYTEAGRFSFGYAKVRLDNNNWGLIDKYGTFVIQPKYSWISNVYESVVIFEQDEKYGLLDLKGNVILKPTFSSVKKDENPENCPMVLSTHVDTEPLINDFIINLY
jgi:hypothetical protein